MLTRLARIATAGVLTTGLGAGALGVASAAGTPSPAPSVKAGAPGAAAKAHRPLLKRTLHGEFAVRRHGAIATVAIQRGEITAVSASSITLKSADGYLGTYAVTQDTKVRHAGSPVAIGTLTTGERAMVFAVKSGSGFVASRVAAAAKTAPSTPPSTAPSTAPTS